MSFECLIRLEIGEEKFRVMRVILFKLEPPILDCIIECVAALEACAWCHLSAGTLTTREQRNDPKSSSLLTIYLFDWCETGNSPKVANSEIRFLNIKLHIHQLDKRDKK